MNSEWTIIQKLAWVHYKMGELISYVPNFNFIGKDKNSPITNNSRNIWKSISDGKSVCNGITFIQRNILSRLGIETKPLSSKTHSFLLTKIDEGNIITDATWDLSNTLYKARPQYFGLTYEELRKREEIMYSDAHKLENPPQNVVNISEQELREIYYSIGLTNEDRTFPFPFLDEVQKINEKEYSTLTHKIDDFFTMFAKKFSGEAGHLSETRSLLEVSINELGIPKDQIKTKFVYSKDDGRSENPYLILHINYEDLKDKIRLLNIDADETTFKNINVEEFDNQYRLHHLDTTKPFWQEYMKNKENTLQIEPENYKIN